MNPWAVPHCPARSLSFWDEPQGPAMPNCSWDVLGLVNLMSPSYHLLAFSAGWELRGGEMVGGRESPGMREAAKCRLAGELGTAAVPGGWGHLVAGDNVDTPRLNLQWEADPLRQDTTGLNSVPPTVLSKMSLDWKHTR